MTRSPAAVRSAWQILWPGIAALAAAMGIGRFVYTPILPEMLAAGVLTLREAGWVASANFAGYLAGAMAAAVITHPGRQARLARWSLVVSLLTVAAIGATQSLTVWMLLRFIGGVASAFTLIFVAARALERLNAIGAAGQLMWLFAGVGIGIVGSSLLAIGAQGQGVGWQGMWLMAALLAAAFTALAWSAAGRVDAVGRGSPAEPAPAARRGRAAAELRPAVAAESKSAGSADRQPADAAERLFIAALIAYGLFGLGYVIHATYLPALVRAAGYPAQAALWIWVLVGVAALPSMLAWGAIVRRFGERRAIAICYAVEGVTALTPLVTDSIVGAAIAAVGLGSCFMPVSGIAFGYVRSLDPIRAARRIGLMTAAFGLGQIVGPLAAAYLAAGRGFALPSLLACVALLAASAMMSARLGAALTAIRRRPGSPS